MFNPRGGFSGQRPMGLPRMNQPSMSLSGMGMSNMSMSGLGMSSMGMSSLSTMSQSTLNLTSLNQSPMSSSLSSGMNHQRMGLPPLNPNLGINSMNQSGMNQSGMNVYRMGPSGMNQGGMGYQSEMKSQPFGMRSMDSPGSFLGGSSDPMGMKNVPLRAPMHQTPERHMAPQSLPQRFSSPSGPMTSQPRMHLQNQDLPPLMNRMPLSSDLLRGNPKPPLQEPTHLMKEKPLNAHSLFGNLKDLGMKSGPSSMEQMPGSQNRYTSESASSILQSFGLSNEDLEELSRYPDDQLTPVNLPSILKDIRLRKMNRSGGPHDQGGSGRRPGGEVGPSKVIDYGHSSKYHYNDSPVSSRPFDSGRNNNDTPISSRPFDSGRNNNDTPLSRPFDSGRPNPKMPPSVYKESPAPPANTKNVEQASENSMGLQIPTLCHRKASLPDRSNKKTLVGDQPSMAMDNKGMIPKAESAVITIQPDTTPLCDIPVILDAPVMPHTDQNAEVKIGTVVNQGNYQPEAAPMKSNWAPPMSQEEAQKMKKVPTPSMMNDYFAASPRIFPHICSLCNIECRHVKDWIQHQNNNVHIESCRKLRQQYPEWNPQVHTLRNDGKKDETTPRRSKSKSVSPRRSRRSGSLHKTRRSRSRSPRPGKRSRSRSPRRSRHSPKRSRSPRRGARSPQRSLSPRRQRRDRSGSGPDKRAVDAAVQRFIEASKVKGGEKEKTSKPPSNGKHVASKPTNSNTRGKKPTENSASTRKPSSSSSDVKKTNSSSSHPSSTKKPASTNNSVKKPSSTGGSSPRRPPPPPAKSEPSTTAPRKPVVSTGAKKTTPNVSAAKKPPLGKRPPGPKVAGTQKLPASELFNPLHKFTTSKGVFNDKIIHVTNLPDSGYTDQDILKVVQPFGRVCDILLVRSKNEAFLETNFREAASAAVKFSETTPVMINNKRVTLSLAGQHRAEPNREYKQETKISDDVESAEKPSAEIENREQEIVHEEEHKEEEDKIEEDQTEQKEELLPPRVYNHDIEVPPGFVKRHRLADPPLTEAEKCVVVISNLPEKQYTQEEIANLAKPFGGTNDILIISTHRKAYLELASRSSVDSMMKFYSVFPTFLGGNSLNIAMSTRYKDVKDEDRIFAEVIENAPYKITSSIYEKFVHFTNLPDKEIDEFEIARIGLRFGKVEHYMVISNKRKAILHMNSSGAAKAMNSFLTLYPVCIEESVIICSLATKTKLAEDEYETYLEEENSTEPEINMFEGEVAPTPDELKQDESNNPSSPVSEMDVDVAADNGDQEEEYDEEEAAEAPEAPEGQTVFIPPQPVEQQEGYNGVPQTYMSEQTDVYVSVESDEEEIETQGSFSQKTTKDMEHLMTAEESEEHDSEVESSVKAGKHDASKPLNNQSSLEQELQLEGVAVDDLEPKSESEEDEAAQVPENAAEASGKGQGRDKSRMEDKREKDTKSKSSTTSSRDGRHKHNDDRSRSYEDKSRSRRDRSRPSGGNEKDSRSAKSGAPQSRATKFNPQKGELSITLTVDGQKSSKTPDSRKRPSGERLSSGRESSTPKSSSNRSSPSENLSTGQKSSSGGYQSKSSYRSAGSQDRDSKVTSRSREGDSRSSGRKDDRSKESNSSSSRYTRNTRGSARGPKSTTEEAEIDSFPFNLDEFVTVDEIVEEHGDSQKADEGNAAEAASANSRGKRKEDQPPGPGTQAAKEAELSFVTLDEVGDEDGAAAAAGTSQAPKEQSLTGDKLHVQNVPTTSAKDSDLLMTLDDVSDDDDVKDTTATQPSSSAKDQLLTLDVCGAEGKQKDSSVGPETKEKEKRPDVPTAKPEQESPMEQSLLTLDEVQAEDEDEPFGDAEAHFLTVDEVGGEEEETENKSEGVEEAQPNSETKKASQPQSAAKTPVGKRGRPSKRPLTETAENSNDTPPQTPVSSTTTTTPDKTPAKATPGKAKITKGKEESSTVSTPDKAQTGDGKSQVSVTPAKKSKLETTPTEKAKLGPFNSAVAVGLEFLVPKTGYFCELCSLFYMDDASKIKHCKSLRHYQAVQKHMAKQEESAEGKTPST